MGNIIEFMDNNFVEITINDVYWVSKEGQRYLPRYRVVINGCDLSPMQLQEAMNYYIRTKEGNL